MHYSTTATQFHRQSDKHPWLHILNRFRSEETAHLIRLANSNGLERPTCQAVAVTVK